MAFSKRELFNGELRQLAAFGKALAHPARLAILKHLAEINTCMTGDIADELPLSRTTVNQHLKELKDTGLITGTVEGVKTCYCINNEKLDELRHAAGKFLDSIHVSRNPECKSDLE